MRHLTLKTKPPKLSIGDRVVAASYGAKAQWPAGFQLYQRGAPADGIFIVLHGHIVLRTPVKGGRGFVSTIAMAGETFGAEGLAYNGKYSTDASASDDAETLQITTEKFRALVREQPANAISLISQVMSERAILLERLQEMASLHVEDRLVASLLRLSHDVAFVREDGMLHLESQHHRLLCEMVGATRESITLAMSRMVMAGEATRDGNRVIVDPSKLQSRISSQRYDTTTPIEVVQEMGSRF